MIGGLESLDYHCQPCVCWCDPPTPPPSEHAGLRLHTPTLPHRPRDVIGARALISSFLAVLTSIPSACRVDVGLPSPLLISVHVPSPSRVPPTLSSPPSQAPVCHRGRKARRVVESSRIVGTAVYLDFCDAVRALFADAAPGARSCASLMPRPTARGTPCKLRVVSAS